MADQQDEKPPTKAEAKAIEKAEAESDFIVDGVHPDPLTAMRPSVEDEKPEDEQRVRLVPVDWQVHDVAFPDPTATPDAAGYVPTLIVGQVDANIAPFYVAEKDADTYINGAAKHGLAITKVSI